MEFRITKNHKTHSTYLVLANLLIMTLLSVFVIQLGQSLDATNYIDIVFELASCLLALLLFIAAAKVSISGVKMGWLLVGLFLFQTGALIDVLDEVVTFNFLVWSVIGDAIQLAGELTLATVALLFIGLTNRIASTDRLTNLYNKAFHNRWIDDYLEKSSRPLAIIAIDLDKFKSINDRHGHAFGDTALTHIGGLLRDFMRLRRGVASRTGGEEFEVTLKNTSEQDALAIAEQIRAMIENNPPEGIDKVTASVGIALSVSGETGKALRKRADAAAYFSKQSGRNRVSLAGENQTMSVVS